MNDQSSPDGSFDISDEVWTRISPLLPAQRKKLKKGRPRLGDRQAMASIFYKIATHCSWKALPRRMAAGSTAFDRFQEWRRAGVFEQMRQVGILQIDDEV